jgi:hypothetical protein
MGKTYLPPREYICAICNISFKRYGNNTFFCCSRACSNIYKSKKIKQICMNCNEEYFITQSQVKWAKIRGNTRNFCSYKCRNTYKVRENNNNWKGGKHHTKRGYIKIYIPEHPNNIYGYCYEHRLVMEKHIGRYLTEHEDVHHINEIKSDNRIENLELLTSSEHSKKTIQNNHKRKLMTKKSV